MNFFHSLKTIGKITNSKCVPIRIVWYEIGISVFDFGNIRTKSELTKPD